MAGTALPTQALAALMPNGQPREAFGNQQAQHVNGEHQRPESFVQRTFDDPVAAFTLWLALATTALWWFTYKLWNATSDMATRADEAKDLAARQLSLQGLQTDLLEKQKEISRAQYLAEHRPRLFVKDVYFLDENFGQVIFEIVNTGNSTACSVFGSFVEFNFVSDPHLFKNPERAERELLLHNGFRGGSFRPFGIGVQPDVQQRIQHWTPEHVNEVRPQPFFFGMILYTDERGEEGGSPVYATVFRRRWNFEAGSFERTGNPDHEYEG